MSDPVRWTGQMPSTRQQQQPPSSNDGANLADILERVLDKGIVIAGDIQINLLDIELLTIKIRLVVASVDRAKEMGIDWWERDPTLSSGHRELEDENARLRKRLEALENGTTGELTDGDEAEPEDVDDAEDAEDAEDVDDAEEIDDEPEDEGPEDGEVVDEEPEPEPEPAPAPRRRTAKRSRS